MISCKRKHRLGLRCGQTTRVAATELTVIHIAGALPDFLQKATLVRAEILTSYRCCSYRTDCDFHSRCTAGCPASIIAGQSPGVSFTRKTRLLDRLWNPVIRGANSCSQENVAAKCLPVTEDTVLQCFNVLLCAQTLGMLCH